MYYLRLDDACEKRNIENWNRIERILDIYQIKPLVGIIPKCEDPMMNEYSYDNEFWNRVEIWKNKGWTIALHGYTHVFETTSGGVNPVNQRSEFAGVALEKQKYKIKYGVQVLRSHGIDPKVFFAPAHTFDMNTLIALKEESNINIISDTVAYKPYNRWGFTFVPQQSGHVRTLPLNTVTFCYHPNNMCDKDFEILNDFLKKNCQQFRTFGTEETTRKYSIVDRFFAYMYFAKRKMRGQI